MIYFKSTSGDVFAYESEADREQYGSPELVAMTAAEVDAHLSPRAVERDYAAEIEALERQYMLPRPVRDVMLGLMEKEAAAIGVTPTQLRQVNSGYRRVKELDEQIAAPRALL